MAQKKVYRRRRRPVRYSKSKQLVTGHGPTLLEKIASGVGSAAKLATAVAPVIAAINTEMKYVDNAGTVTFHSPGTSDSLVHLTANLINGTQDNQRVGNSILAKDLQLRMALNFQPSAGPPVVSGLHCRATIVCWKENAKVNAPTVAKIFEVPTNIYSAMNKDYTDQFVVLKDKFFTMTAVNANLGTGSQGFQAMKIFKNLNWHMRWDGAAGTDATLNHVYLILRSSASGAGTAASCTYYTRLNYTDN